MFTSLGDKTRERYTNLRGILSMTYDFLQFTSSFFLQTQFIYLYSVQFRFNFASVNPILRIQRQKSVSQVP